MPIKKKDKHPIFDRSWQSLSALNTYLKSTREKPKYFDGMQIITAKGRYALSFEGLSFTPGKFDPPDPKAINSLFESRPEELVKKRESIIVAKSAAVKKTVKQRKPRKPRTVKKK